MKLTDYSLCDCSYWRRFGDGFTVEIVRRQETPSRDRYGEYGQWRWNLYAYIGHVHPLFARIPEDANADCAALACFPGLHGGCTFVEHRVGNLFDQTDDGLSRSRVARHTVKFGSDYMHLGDEWFTRCDTPNCVECDANELFAALAALGRGETLPDMEDSK